MVKIAEIVDQNPWWKHGADFTQYDHTFRKISPIYFKRKEIELKKGNVYIIRGPRQVGKTTYLKHTVKNLLDRGINPRHVLYLSLDFFTSRSISPGVRADFAGFTSGGFSP